MRTRPPALVLAGLLASAAALAQPDPRPPHQPPPRSHYPDGTGNSDVDRLNAGQLDGNYRGPWHPAPPGRGMVPPDGMEPGTPPPDPGPFGPIPLPPPGHP